MDGTAPSLVSQVDALTEESALQFYDNAVAERLTLDLSDGELETMWDGHVGLGHLLDDRRRFRYAHVAPIVRAGHLIFSRFTRPRILDVCCGIGTESLLFAGMGADVVSLDLNPDAVSVFKKRVAWYGQFDDTIARRISIIEGDAKAYPYDQLGSFDAIFSSGGIGVVLSAAELFQTLAPSQKPGGLIVLKNGNPQALWNRVLRRRLRWSPAGVYLREAEKAGYGVVHVTGTCSLPRAAYRLGGWITHVDARLNGVRSLNLLLEYAFERQP